MKRYAFTLLEAVLALAILSAVIVACLGARARSIAAGSRIADTLQRERDADAIFEMLRSGLMPEPVIEEETGARLWIGEHLGEPYRLTGTQVEVRNPIPEQDRPPVAASAGGSGGSGGSGGDRIVMWRYVLEYRGDKMEFVWHG